MGTAFDICFAIATDERSRAAEAELHFMEFPEMVRDNIFRLLDYDSRIQSRLVCSQWRDSIDNYHQGFTVTIDDRDAVNTELMNNIVIREAHVLSLREPCPDFFSKPKLLIVAKFYGQIPMHWFISHVLKPCTNLTKLILRGDFMCAQELTQYLPATTPTQIHCPNLKCLELIFNEPDNFPYSPKGNTDSLPGHEVADEPPMQPGQSANRFGMLEHGIYAVDLQRIDQRQLSAIQKVVGTVNRNMIFLLKLIRSSRLELFHIQDVVFPLYGSYRYWSFSWKAAPLREFLQFHSSTLRYLYLPAYLGHDDSAANSWETLYPRSLWEIDILLHFRDMRRPSSIWEVMISTQTCLQELTLNIFRYPVSLYQALFWSFPPTLRKLIIRIQLRPEDFQAQLEINGVAFSQWRYLEYFHIQNVHGKWGWNELGFTNESIIFTNLCLLPPTLRILVLRKLNVAPIFSEQLSRFRRIIHIQIGSLMPNVNEPGNAAKIFNRVLRMRWLNSAEIYFRNEIGNSTGCPEMFRDLFPMEPKEEAGELGMLDFCTRYFCSNNPPKTVAPFKDGTGMAILNFLPDKESERKRILGLRLLPKHITNQSTFLELFEAPRNREVTFRIFDSGNLYLAPFQDIYWSELANNEKAVTLELIVKKSSAEQSRLRDVLQQDVLTLGCCGTVPAFTNLELLEAED